MEKIKCLVLAVLLIACGSRWVRGETREILVRVTFYYPNEAGSGYKASTGCRLKPWEHCAVDPRVIKYGKTVNIPELGSFVAVDRGTAVVSRKAALLCKKNVPVVDVCVRSRREMDRMAAQFPRFIRVTVKS